MQAYHAQLRPLSAFATPLRGDTLFGQLCWLYREACGKDALETALSGYTYNKPFLVCSDPFPTGYLPRPSLPLSDLMPATATTDASKRKAQKSAQWLPLAAATQPVNQWLNSCVAINTQTSHLEQHNSLNRLTGSTTKGEGFAPYTLESLYLPECLDIYLVLDEQYLTSELALSLLQRLGEQGYGKDASTGKGRFEVLDLQPWQRPEAPQANAWLTLAPCAPQGLHWQEKYCAYSLFTRFGRHGQQAAITGKPYKAPVLLANTGALLTPSQWSKPLYTGQGLTEVSLALPNTCQQGYTPVLPVNWPHAQGA